MSQSGNSRIVCDGSVWPIHGGSFCRLDDGVSLSRNHSLFLWHSRRWVCRPEGNWKRPPRAECSAQIVDNLVVLHIHSKTRRQPRDSTFAA